MPTSPNVVVTRGTSILSEYFGHTAPSPVMPSEAEQADQANAEGGEQRGEAEDDDDDNHTAHSTDTQETAHTEPLSDLEEEGEAKQQEAMPTLLSAQSKEGEVSAPISTIPTTTTTPTTGSSNSSSSQQPQQQPRYLATSSFLTARWKQDLPISLVTPGSAATTIQSPFSDLLTPVSAMTLPATPMDTTTTTTRVNSVGSVLASPSVDTMKQQPNLKVRKGLMADNHSDLYGELAVEQQMYPIDGYGNTSLLVAAKMDDARAVIKMIRGDFDANVTNVSESMMVMMMVVVVGMPSHGM